MNKDFKLDFIGIGAPRCGTTWISEMLAEHPEICMAREKELHFFLFLKQYNKGLGYLASQFPHCKEEQKRGEWSVDYLYSAEAAERIKKHNQDIKILVCLRNPVERAHSHYLLQHYSAAISPMVDFPAALKADRYGYLMRGKYAKHLRKYFEIFPRKNIRILIYEEFVANPDREIRNLYEFLGVNPSFCPSNMHETIDYRARRKFYSLYLQGIINKLFALYRVSPYKKYLYYSGIGPLLKSLKKLNERVESRKFKRSSLDSETKKTLKKIYEGETLAIEKITGKKLPSWRN